MLLRQLVPAFVIGFYFVSKRVNNKVFSNVLVLGFSLILLLSYPKQHVAILWTGCCLTVYGYGCRMFDDHVFSACYAILSAHFGGWLYEVPFWHPPSMFFSFRYPWVINTQILSGVFCAWLLKKREIRVNKTMLLAILGYVTVSLLYIASPTNSISKLPVWWVPRLGVVFLLGSILTGIVGEVKK